jgi:AraC-like DNA-binding protein
MITAMTFDDAGAFSKALSQSNVVCMQTLPGAVEFKLNILTFPELELHLTSMPVGGCIALGDAARDSVSFHVPLSEEGSISLLGMSADASGLAAYAMGGELAVQASAGARLAYIVPNSRSLPDLYRIFFEDDDPEHVRRTHRVTVEAAELNKLKALLNEIALVVEISPAAFSNPAMARNLQQSVLGQVFAVAGKQVKSHAPFGRAQRAHAQIVKKVHDYLLQLPGEPLFVLDLCRAMGISQPTLFRAFRQTLGIGPKEYLQIRRLHLSRQRLLHDPDPGVSVHAVAYDLGFWHLGRFGSAYRAMFGEMPSRTLRRRKDHRDRG